MRGRSWVRGTLIVEYALLVIALLLLGAGAVKAFGPKHSTSAYRARTAH